MFINFYELLIFLIFTKRLDFFQETGIFRDISQNFSISLFKTIHEEIMEKNDDSLHAAYLHTMRNRDEIKRSDTCCCIGCLRLFQSMEVVEYVDRGHTAICPYCGADTVIGDASGVRLTTAQLALLNKYYF